jgi:hypothetical protein
MRVVFFGASVTAQSKNYSSQSITGYVTFLDEVLSGSAYSVARVAYGSCQYSNMGLYGFSNVILAKPSVVFFEWHTTGEMVISAEMLLRQKRLLSSLGITMILLVLPSKKHNFSDNIDKYTMLPDLDLPCLDLRYLGINSEEVHFLRDDVHTNEVGAELYAKIIDKFIRDRILCLSQPATDFSLHDLFEYGADEQGALLYREIQLDVLLRPGDFLYFSLDRGASIIFSFTRGPLCPDLEIGDSSLANSRIEHILDQWSYYNRQSCGLELAIDDGVVHYIMALKRIPDISRFCPKAMEPLHAGKLPLSIDDLVFDIKSIFVPIDSMLTLRRA